MQFEQRDISRRQSKFMRSNINKINNTGKTKKKSITIKVHRKTSLWTMYYTEVQLKQITSISKRILGLKTLIRKIMSTNNGVSTLLSVEYYYQINKAKNKAKTTIPLLKQTHLYQFEASNISHLGSCLRSCLVYPVKNGEEHLFLGQRVNKCDQSMTYL